MKYNPEIHHRKSIRLKGYDYTQPGAYFITFCTYQRMHLFGEVVDGKMVLNDAGKIAREEWFKTAEVRPYVKLYEGEFVIMPNHGHGIIWIEGEQRARQRRAPTSTPTSTSTPTPTSTLTLTPAPTETMEKFGKPVKGSIPTIVRAYKSAVAYAVNGIQNQRGAVLWQSNYYEHVIRNDRELKNIGWYILNNPLNWQLDRDNAQNARNLCSPENVEQYVMDVEEMALKRKPENQ